MLSTLLTLLSLLFVLFRRRLKSVADVLKGIRDKVLLSLGGILFWAIGRLHVVMVRVVLFLPLIRGIGGFSLMCMVSTGGLLIPLSC